MEQELDSLMQEEHDRHFNHGDDDFQDDDADEDEMSQSMDLDRFEKKLSQQKRQNQFKVQNSKKRNSSSSESESDEPIQKQSVKQTESKKPPIAADSMYEELISKAKEMRENNGVGKPPKKQQQPSSFEMVQQQYAHARSKDRRQDEILEEVLKSNNDGFKEKKLKELLQRNRNLTMQYDKEKALQEMHYSHLKIESQLNQMIKDHEEFIQYQHTRHNAPKDSDTLSVRSSHSNLTAKSPSKVNKTKENSDEQQEDWKDKFNKTDKKLQEFRVQNNQLKNELNKALRIITKEVGENVSIDKILLEENGWKGRAQQIEKLRNKVKELQQKMGNMSYTSMNSDMSGMGSVHSNMRGASVGGMAAQQSASDRRKEQEEMKVNLDKLKTEYDLVCSKLKAVNARKLILEKEQKDMRAELDSHKKLLLDKSNNDDRYIAALKAEVEKLKSRGPEVINKVVYQRMESQPTTMQKQSATKEDESVTAKLRQDIQYLRSEVESKERMIAELISEKIKADKGLKLSAHHSKASTESGGANIDELNTKVTRLEETIRTLRKEREEFFESKVADKESSSIIKDLSLQNAKLRSKIDDLMSKK